MAVETIYISRQNYKLENETANQFNGWKPNVFSEELVAKQVTLTAGDENGGVIPADFKDHKTAFIVTAQAEANVTFKAGNTDGGAKDVIAVAPAGTSIIWLDSAPFVEKATGEIAVKTDKQITIVGYEMR